MWSNTNTKMNIGVIGTGRIAKFHLDVLMRLDDVQVIALCNRGGPGVQQLAESYQIPSIYSDYRVMLTQLDLDALFVLVSVDQISSVAADCLRTGIPTFIEKPAGLSSAETARLANLADEYQCINMVGLNRRFYSVMRYAKEAILERGPLMGITIEAPERIQVILERKKFSEGVLGRWAVVNSIHTIDMFRYFGGEVRHVHALQHAWKERNGDSFVAIIDFAQETIGTYISHWQSPGGWRIHLYGNGIRAEIEPLEQGILAFSDNTRHKIPVSEYDKQFKPGFYLQDSHFIDCARTRHSVGYPAVDLQDVIPSVKLVEAVAGY